MTDTPNLGLTYLEAAQSQKHVGVNEGFRLLDTVVQASVADKDLTAPPGSPTNGDTYIVAAGASGLWAGQSDNLAAWKDNAWQFYEPKYGWFAYVVDEDLFYYFTSSGWVVYQAPIANPATLDKPTAGDDAVISYTTGGSTRAIQGTAGTDDYSIKTSPDGSTFKTALVADKDDGTITFPENATFSAYLNYDAYIAADTATKVPFNNELHDDNAAFDTGDNDFTAPVTGQYEFHASLFYKLNSTAIDSITMHFYVNGTLQPQSKAYILNDWGHSSIKVQSCLSIALTAGDTVDVRVTFETQDGYVEADTNNFFGRFLG